MKTVVLSDIHSNYIALKAVISCEAPFDAIICTGDFIFGGTQPNEVVSTLKEFDGYFILGNHDIEMIHFHNGCQFWSDEYQNWLDEVGLRDVFTAWLEWEYQELTPESVDFLASLPQTLSIQIQNLNIRLCHGHDWSIRLMPNASMTNFENVASLYEESIIISGHTHTQFRRLVGKKLFVNPGTVGGDYRLGHTNVCYAVIQDGIISLKHAPYDVHEFCLQMAKINLPDEYNNKVQEAYRKAKPWPGLEFLDYTYLLKLGVY